ncbi:MAG: DegT/DnrJ/EryC1/StrS family aminotransferase [Alphaproteobacteria bacterium]|nr:DegT/DnrJ/EryC1/StrS family aminotransferase [Alphaproteobacteria bacterium]MCB9697982.1 DegT/DnrJ/EryC1/StrS family aminotransferase [Alphaproteobacteria bacterium]
MIPFVDPGRRHAEVAEAVEGRVLEVLRSGRWIGGPVVAEAEGLAARWLGRRGAVGVASGTDALILALQALGVGAGDEVIVPAFTFFATAGAVLAIGAVPVLADVGEDALLDGASAADAASPRTRAMIPVHLFGSRWEPVDLGVPIVDDAAQAIGAEPTPCTGALTVLSAYPTKTWGAAGDAGFVAGDDEELLARVRSLSSHGARSPGHHGREMGHAGRASRLDAVQAAVLVGHAQVLRERIDRRRALAARYDEGLPDRVRPLRRSPGCAVHQYVVRVEGRDELVAALARAGVGTAVYYPRPLTAQPALDGCPRRPTPVAERLAEEVLALPIADCGPADVDRVCEVLAELRP